MHVRYPATTTTRNTDTRVVKSMYIKKASWLLTESFLSPPTEREGQSLVAYADLAYMIMHRNGEILLGHKKGIKSTVIFIEVKHNQEITHMANYLKALALIALGYLIYLAD
jgi:hypothetical protein